MEASAVPAEASIGLNDPVAGDDDGHVVVPVCSSNCPARAGIAEFLSEPSVACRSSERDFEEPGPHRLLPGSSAEVQGEVERSAIALEILLELANQADQMVARPGRWVRISFSEDLRGLGPPVPPHESFDDPVFPSSVLELT